MSGGLGVNGNVYAQEFVNTNKDTLSVDSLDKLADQYANIQNAVKDISDGMGYITNVVAEDHRTPYDIDEEFDAWLKEAEEEPVSEAPTPPVAQVIADDAKSGAEAKSEPEANSGAVGAVVLPTVPAAGAATAPPAAEYEGGNRKYAELFAV